MIDEFNHYIIILPNNCNVDFCIRITINDSISQEIIECALDFVSVTAQHQIVGNLQITGQIFLFQHGLEFIGKLFQ